MPTKIISPMARFTGRMPSVGGAVRSVGLPPGTIQPVAPVQMAPGQMATGQFRDQALGPIGPNSGAPSGPAIGSAETPAHLNPQGTNLGELGLPWAQRFGQQ